MDYSPNLRASGAQMSETMIPSRLQLEKPFPRVSLRTFSLPIPARPGALMSLHCVCQLGSDVQHLSPEAEEVTLVVCPYAKGIKQC